MGRVFKFHNDVDTDQIIASQYLLLPNIEEMKVYTFESIDKDFAKKVKEGDIVVAGENFGCGSSREQAPEIIKALGIQCVIAKSFARIFFRNSINNGLLLIEQPDLYDDMKEGDTIDVVMNQYVDYNGKEYPVEVGDVTFCADGNGHGIKNAGEEDLVFVALILKE